jgi:type I restriction enzyme M protein
MPKKPASSKTPAPAADLKAVLWAAADKLRGNMDAAEYKHIAIGLIFLKYISDAFMERHAFLTSAPKSEGHDPEDRDEYIGENIFWVPAAARWPTLQARAKLPTIGKAIDDAMDAIEKDNPSLKGVLPRGYAGARLDPARLGELIDVFSTLGLGDAESRSKDVIGEVYEYFLGMFASAEGKRGGQFYTPKCVVQTLVEMLAPYKGRVYDPCCGSGGMFVSSEKFIRSHQGNVKNVSIYGQESNHTTRRLALMNLAIRGIDARIEWGDTFHADKHPTLFADYVLANPPFNDSDWGGEKLRTDHRWTYGVPPEGNANFAWVQHFLYHTADHGIAGFVLANGSMSGQQSGEGEIRKKIIEADLVDCMVAMPGQLFTNTQIPVCLWFLSKDKSNGLGLKGSTLRNRSKQTLFIDARKLGVMKDRVHRDLPEAEIARIADTYHAWRGDGEKGRKYADIPGFCKAVTTADIAQQNYVLTPGRYVGAEEVEDTGDPFEVIMPKLVKDLEAHFAESHRLEAAIRENLREFVT